jgi:tetratricopeptide (TPR) repeat protein
MQKFLAQNLQIGLIFIALMSPFFAYTQSKDDDRTREVEADTLLNRQEYSAALPLYDALIRTSNPSTEEEYRLYYKRAVCYYGLQNFAEALTDVNKYIEKYPQEQAKLLRAYIHQELENVEAQLADINDLLSKNPESTELLQWRASVYMEAEKYAEAQKDIQKLLAYQASPQLKSYLGLAYYYQNNADSALILFDEAISEDATFLQTYIYAASLCMDEGAYEMALTYIEKGLRVEPSNMTLIFYKGVAMVETEQVDEGCRCLTKAFNNGMDDVGDYLKQYCYGAN